MTQIQAQYSPTLVVQFRFLFPFKNTFIRFSNILLAAVTSKKGLFGSTVNNLLNEGVKYLPKMSLKFTFALKTILKVLNN